MIECLEHVGMLLLSGLSCQECSTYTIGQQGFHVPDSPTVTEEKGFRRQHKLTMETGQQMCWTRDRTALQRTRENSTLVCTLGSARRNQETHRVHGGQDQTSLVLHRVRGWTKQRILHSSKCTRDTESHCSECADTNLFSAELTKRVRCDRAGYGAQPPRMTMNDANKPSTVPCGRTKEQLLNWFFTHQRDSCTDDSSTERDRCIKTEKQGTQFHF